MLSTTTSISRSGSRLSSESTATDIQPSSKPPVLLPEIWLLVIPYLKTLDLQSISLTCSTFRYMAQPLLFSVLDVSPFLLSYNAEKPILRPPKYLDRFVERLEYFKLPHIVHGVHHCWISPYSRSGFPNRNQQDDLDPNSIIDVALEALPHFPNLSTLSWHCIDITPQWWDKIQSLNIKNSLAEFIIHPPFCHLATTFDCSPRSGPMALGRKGDRPRFDTRRTDPWRR
ncbi:hypothetical protein BDZ97DRAFT_1385703 [Flammula alnicola]|nr:hypothetical protein BDZ97DRAFT_1385703 [Flammula alnicola]